MVTAISPGSSVLRRNVEPGQGIARWPEWLCLTAYGCLLVWMIPHHEPWADEAQAWMLARSLSLWQLFHEYLRYEGAPGLWHLLLWILVRLHVSYAGMHWVSGAIAACGIYVLLFHSPFPRWMKFSMPFTVFLVYQYAVVARNYVLVPLLLFGIAAAWKRHPVLMAVLLGLLANVAGHAAAISSGFALAWLVENWSHIRSRRDPVSIRNYCLAAGILAVFYLIAVATAWPPRDVYVACYHLPGASGISPAVRALVSPLWATWYPMPLGVLGWAAIIFGLRARGALRFLIPIGAFVVFSGFVLLSYWHAGLLVPVVLAILWITWPKAGSRVDAPEKLLRLAVAVMIVTQIGWAIHAIVYDRYHDTSPDWRAAQFLAPHVAAGDRIAVTFVRDTGTQAFHSVGISPYFAQKIFVNQETPFWWWSRRDRTEDRFAAALASRPRLVVVEDYGLKPSELQQEMKSPKIVELEANGYRLGGGFFAHLPTRFDYQEDLCHLIFVSANSSPNEAATGAIALLAYSR